MPRKSHYSSKIIVITGAASGLGRALSIAFSDIGATVVVCDIDPEGCDLLVGEIKDKGGIALGFELDVAWI